jgi:hypothetical protein
MQNFALSFAIDRKTNVHFSALVIPTTRKKSAVHIAALSEKTIYFQGVVEAETVFQAEELLLQEVQAQVQEHLSISL